MKNKTRCWVSVAAPSLLLFSVTTASRGDVTTPWVVSEHVADTSSLKAFANDHRWKDLNGQARAIAIWKYLVDNETGVFHFNPAREGQDRRDSGLHIVRDPIKMLNSYGYGFCGAFGPTAAGIFAATGFPDARAVGIPGSNHCVTEVWYDGDWHYFDVDLRGIVFERDGVTVASVSDVVEQPELWTTPSRRIMPFFTNDHDLSIYARGYAAKPVDYFYRWQSYGSTMDFRLRKGETLTRWWRPRGGRWAHQDEDLRGEFWRQLLSRKPYGAKSNHANFSIWTHGNGLFEYRPTLRSGCGDFEDGVFDHQNTRLAKDGLTVARDGTGEVIFEVNSPYVIVPKVGDLDDRSDDCEASVVQFDCRGDVRASMSLDHGRSWQDLGPASEGRLDLTPWLRERYQYLIKFTLVGASGEVILSDLAIRTWVQVAPASLPRLKKGRNHLSYKTGDQYGLATTPWMQTPLLGARDVLRRYWTREPVDYDPDRFQQRVRGELELLFPAPPGRQIQWLSLGGFFAAHRRDRASQTANEIWYATGQSDDWQRVYRSEVPDWNDHWHYAWDGEVMLDQPADQVRVRYIGDPGVNAVRVNLHSLRPEPAPPATVTVTHGYEIDGQLVQRRFHFDAPVEYAIECPQTPRNVFISMSLPSDAAEPTTQDDRTGAAQKAGGTSAGQPQ